MFAFSLNQKLFTKITIPEVDEHVNGVYNFFVELHITPISKSHKIKLMSSNS